MEQVSIVLVVVVIICTLALFWNRKLPPGPWGLPFVGYYPFLSGKLYQNFTPLSKKYGEVFSFRTVGGRLVVVLNRPEIIKEVLVHRSEEFSGRPTECNFLRWISKGYGLIQEEGLTWKEHRRFFLHTVKNYGFGKIEMEDFILQKIEILIEDMKKTAGEPTDFYLPVAFVVNSVISHILFAIKHEKNGDLFPKLVIAFQKLQESFSSHRFLLIGPYFEYIAINFFPWSHEIRRSRQFTRELYSGIIDDHIANFDPNSLKDFVDSYLYHALHLKGKGTLETSSFTKERLLGITMNMTMEGTETITAAILSLLLEASKHLREQERVQEELDDVVGRGRFPSWMDKQKLPYLEAFIQELHRTGQSFYTTAQYSNYKETKIRGYTIPKRSILYANLWTINNDSRNFPDPQKFDVNRFLASNGEKIKTEGPYPFGLGKRDCVGQSLASMEVFLILASIFQNFTLFPGKKEGTLKAIQRQERRRKF